MAFEVQAYTDDHTLSARAGNAKEAFAKAVEWQMVHKFTGVTSSDGIRSFTIAEFSPVMALREIDSNMEAAAEPGLKARE